MKEYFLPVSILIAAVLVSGSVLYSSGLKNYPTGGDNPGLVPDGEPADLSLNSEDVILGDPNAKVTIIEYGDFQCPFCGLFFSEAEAQIREDYVKSGKVKFVYRHFAFLDSSPSITLKESHMAAEATECAKDQGKFWQFHDEIFEAEIQDGREHNGNLNREFLMSLARKLGLKDLDFAKCFDSHKYADKVQADYEGAQKVGVSATPTSFVDGIKLEGARPYSQFKLIIDSQLSK